MAMQTTREALVRDTALYAASKAVPGLLTLFSVVVFVRMLSKESYGTYALLFAIANLFGTLASSWIAQSVLRFSTYRGIEPSQFLTATRLAFLISILIAGGLFIVLAVATQAMLWISALDTLLVTVLIFLMTAYTVKCAQLQALISPSTVLLLEVSRSAVALVAGIVLLRAFGPHHELVLIALIISVAVAIRIALKDRTSDLKQLLSWSFDASRKQIATMFRYGWPLSCWTGCVLLLSVGDRYLIQHYYGIGRVGSYAAIYDLVVRGFALYAFPVTLAIHPRIMAAHNAGHHSEARSLRRWAIVVQSAIAVPAFAFLWFVQEFLVIDLLRQDVQSVTLVLPLAVGGFVWQLALVIHKPLELYHATKLMLVLVCVAVSVAMLMNYLLLPKYGTIASAYALAASGVIYATLVEVLSRRSQRTQSLADG